MYNGATHRLDRSVLLYKSGHGTALNLQPHCRLAADHAESGPFQADDGYMMMESCAAHQAFRLPLELKPGITTGSLDAFDSC